MKKFVVIGGMYRSGTTLTETIIGSHSKISIPPGDFPFIQGHTEGKSIIKIFEPLIKKKLWKKWQVSDFSDFYSLSHKEAFIKILTRYAEGSGKEIPGTKSPHNEFYFDIIQQWLKEYDLKFIHLVRNPLDMIASYQHAPYYSAKIKENPYNIAVHSRNWYRSASIGLARTLLNPDRYYLLRYEDLVTNPEDTTLALCNFLGVDFEPERMLNRADYQYHNTNTSFEHVSPTKSKQYIYQPGSRKHFLASSEIITISSICGELAHAMGYEDEEFFSSAPSSAPEEFRVPGLRLKQKLKRVANIHHLVFRS